MGKIIGIDLGTAAKAASQKFESYKVESITKGVM